jgi:hypothetical protein
MMNDKFIEYDECLLRDYKDKMDFPMESLTSAMWGINAPEILPDDEIVEIAARKIRLLKSMLISAGVVSEGIIKAIMEEM